MTVISDTTPVNYLILINKIDLLRELYAQVLLPRAVYDEMQRPSTPIQVRTWVANRPAWLEVRDVDMQDATLNLGAGEREVILLAQSMRTVTALIDDGKARREALARGLIVTGTLGVLAIAAKRNLIDLPETLRDLRHTTFRISDELIGRMLEHDRHRRS